MKFTIGLVWIEGLHVLHMQIHWKITNSMLAYIPEIHSVNHHYSLNKHKPIEIRGAKQAKKKTIHIKATQFLGKPVGFIIADLANLRPHMLLSSIGITIKITRNPNILNYTKKIKNYTE